MKTVKIANVDLNIYDGILGISCSGGADSTILLYHLAKYSQNKIYCYILSTKEWDYKEYPIAQKIVNRISEITGNNKLVAKELRSDKKDLDTLMKLTNDAATRDNVSVIYSGITKRPPATEERTFSTPFNENSTFRDFDIKVPTLYNNTYMPIANHNKKDVYNMYVEADVLDELFPLTFSCVDAIDSHCGKCWWCEERKWAFGRLI